jgi:hypothetical protein
VGLRRKLSRLEKEAQQHCEVLRLPDGTQVRYASEDALEALSAAISGREHWLLPAIRQQDSKNVGLLDLICALERSRERAATEEEALEE